MFDAEPFIPTDVRHAEALELRIDCVSRSPTHALGKQPCLGIRLLEGLGVEGDAHCGARDQHLSRGTPDAPVNLRQVHLFSGELLDQLAAQGFDVGPGAVGENLLCRGLDPVTLPKGATLTFPSGAVVELTGRRTPCRKLDKLGKGLMKRLQGESSPRWGAHSIAGAMGIVLAGGDVHAGDVIQVGYPSTPWEDLPPV